MKKGEWGGDKEKSEGRGQQEKRKEELPTRGAMSPGSSSSNQSSELSLSLCQQTSSKKKQAKKIRAGTKEESRVGACLRARERASSSTETQRHRQVHVRPQGVLGGRGPLVHAAGRAARGGPSGNQVLHGGARAAAGAPKVQELVELNGILAGFGKLLQLFLRLLGPASSSGVK